jgi:hypothetical protein
MSIDVLDDLGFEGRTHYPDHMAKPTTARTSSIEDARGWLQQKLASGEAIECQKLSARISKTTCLDLKKKARLGFSYTGEQPSSLDLMPCATCNFYEPETPSEDVSTPQEDQLQSRRNSFVSSSFNPRCP